MGWFNPRAKCPNCGGKIHTQRFGTKAGVQCQWCGTPLTGRLGLDGKAIAADDPRVLRRAETQRSLEAAVRSALEDGPKHIRELASELGISRLKLEWKIMSVSGVIMNSPSRNMYELDKGKDADTE